MLGHEQRQGAVSVHRLKSQKCRHVLTSIPCGVTLDMAPTSESNACSIQSCIGSFPDVGCSAQPASPSSERLAAAGKTSCRLVGAVSLGPRLLGTGSCPGWLSAGFQLAWWWEHPGCCSSSRSQRPACEPAEPGTGTLSRGLWAGEPIKLLHLQWPSSM